MATANPDTVNSNKSVTTKMRNVMMWISDVLKLGAGDKKSICIMGTVVNILYSPYNPEDAPITKPNIYEIDDGTGVLRVVHWNNFKKAVKNIDGSKQTAAAAGIGSGKTPFEIGTTVEVRGLTQFFREQLEIKAFSVKTVDNPNDEVDRMLIVNQFRKTQAFQSLFSNSS